MQQEAQSGAAGNFCSLNMRSFATRAKTVLNSNPMRILDCKSPVCQELVQGAPMMLDYLCDDCQDAFNDLKANLDC